MTSNVNNINDIQELIIKVLQNSATEQEIEFVRSWLSQDPENKKLYNDITNIWRLSKIKSNSIDYNADEAWKKQLTIIHHTFAPIQKTVGSKSHAFKILLKIAAIFLLAFAMGMLTMVIVLHRPNPKAPLVYTEHIVPYGAKSQILLPDGTKIWLNAGSKLKYALNFNQGSREVFLEGEGYFDVSENKKIPFWVKTYAANIKVVGTAFNIKAYREENKIEAIVERGEIKIYGNDSLKLFNKEISLKIKQQATISIPTQHFTKMQDPKNAIKSPRSYPTVSVKSNVETILFTSWKDKRWIIEREELGSLAVKIGRRYDVSIDFESESLKHFTFSGIIEDETLGQVLKVISLTAPISYTLDKKHLVLKENKSLSKYFPNN